MVGMARARYRARSAAAAGVRGVSSTVGRRRAVRAARFVTNVLRYDDGNRIESNGEIMVQRVALSRPQPVVFDVGANVGQWSTSLLAQPGFPAEVHAFEPSSYTRERAGQNLGDRVHLHGTALGERAGRATLHIAREGAGINSLVEFGDERNNVGVEDVLVDTVDEFARSHLISDITLLKIDAEGSDLAVLRGAFDMLTAARIGVAQFEYNWRWVFSRSYLKDVFDLIEGLPEYTVGKVTHVGVEFYSAWHFELETFREANYVIVRRDWTKAFPAVTWWGG